MAISDSNFNPTVLQQNALGLLDVPTNDPPPPYPSPERRTRTLRISRRHTLRTAPHFSSRTPLANVDPDALPNHTVSHSSHPPPASDELSETTPLLNSSSVRRPRTDSHSSTVVSSNSCALSFSRTILSFRRDSEDDSDIDIFEALRDDYSTHRENGITRDYDGNMHDSGRPPLSRHTLVKYFQPLTRRVYHAAVFHLLVLNFPYALIAWIYLFVFTLTGTTLLITLPLGALLCFLDLLGARIFARGELALQSKFHGPLAYPPPYPPRPIFQRRRLPELSDAESGASGAQYETSFYKNAYAMFTDTTTYQALFYFLVIKPGITLFITIALLVLVPVSYVFVLPAPLMLRFVRKLGIWQANVAVEGLYYQVT